MLLFLCLRPELAKLFSERLYSQGYLITLTSCTSADRAPLGKHHNTCRFERFAYIQQHLYTLTLLRLCGTAFHIILILIIIIIMKITITIKIKIKVMIMIMITIIMIIRIIIMTLIVVLPPSGFLLTNKQLNYKV